MQTFGASFFMVEIVTTPHSEYLEVITNLIRTIDTCARPEREIEKGTVAR